MILLSALWLTNSILGEPYYVWTPTNHETWIVNSNKFVWDKFIIDNHPIFMEFTNIVKPTDYRDFDWSATNVVAIAHFEPVVVKQSNVWIITFKQPTQPKP